MSVVRLKNYRRRDAKIAEIVIGTVAINVLEGKVDHGRIGESAGYAPDVLQRFLDQSLCGRATPDCAGVPMQRAPIDRAIGIIADLPGVNSVGGTLSPGGPIGTSDLTLDATADPDRVWTIGVDNFGNRYIGRDRVSTGVRMNNPTGIGDRLIADLITSGRGMSNGYLEYSLPIGYAGWRTGLSATHSVYKLGAPFDLTDSHGKADILSPYLAYPLIRSQDKNLYFRGSYSAKWLEDDVLDSAFKKREHAFSLGLNGDTVDGLLGGGANGYALSYGRGRITLAGTASPAGVPNNSGDFDKINYSLWRDQTLGYFNSSTTRLSLYGALRGQSANRNLDSVEKFTLGGPGGVRAYPVGEAIGDEGKLATLELRYSTSVTAFGGSNLTLALFRDQGWLTVNHRPWAGYTGPATRQLHGNGVGIEFSRRNAFAWKLVWAVRDRGGELPTSDDTNRNRFWLQGSLIF
ncbi:ShlB/FhaC/HecB family hemolysin secretion/activation protein [uncultured Propionivibrio sp.]|uniref:ShlB/FhaC/HecB family hemolysin secretion/activation protein n=1 Tax=uncultured Propionivibrio sp. TaxID=426737 RepID=UPI0029C05A27|nr:ShlB/FhaC/HecB family hemolysin secretion/activation protein [uncultured Propionivibrio sp.]